MGLRFNPPPNWPPPPPGFVPPPRWQPDPAWPPPPPGWQLWVPDDGPAGPPDYPGGSAGPRDFAGQPRDFAAGPGDFADRPGDFADRPPDFTTGPRGFAASSRDFRGGPAAFAAGTGAFAAGTGEFAAGRDEYPGGPGEFAARPGEFAGRPGEFGDGGGDFGAGAATELDPFGAGAYPGPPGGRGPDPRRGGTNGFAIAAFVISLLGGTLLSLILAAIALRQIRRTPQRGRGLAIASIVLSVIWGAVLAYFLVASPAKTPSNPSATGGGTSSAPAPSPSISPSGGSTGTSVFALRTGQCFQNPPASQAVLGITTVTVVPCTTRHNAQVFVEFAATGSSTYPGRSALKRQADTGCHARISGNVASSKITNSMTLRFLYPLQVSWAEGHRTITCLIVDAKPDLKSSLLRAHPKH